jgi:putative ABC transport system permease protein
VTLFETIPQWPRASAAYLNYLDWRRLNNTCADLAALRWSDLCDTREIGASGLYAVLRTKSDPASLRDAVRAEIRNADPDYIVSNIRPMDEIVTGTLASRRVLLTLLGTFAGIALLLAAVGIYGVISYSVSQRTREIGIRMALGAKSGDILRSVVGQGAVLSIAGIALGVIASFFLTRFMNSLLFGVGRTDPLTFCGVALALGIVAVCASFLSALRGSRADPLSALRCE